MTKMTLSTLVNRLVAGVLTSALPFIATAQKLPDSQDKSLRAPKGVKVDGKADEWGTLQAFNKNTEIAYTMANDDSTLYFVVQSATPNIIGKILRGGITLTLNTEGKKREKDAVSVTFPVPADAVQRTDSRAGGGVVLGGGGGGGRTGTITVVSGGSSLGGGAVAGDAATIKRRRDSIAFVNNTKSIEKAKDVKVKGIAAITDSLLSIYNEEGIKARSTYVKDGVYTYELAIPLKYLGISLKEVKEGATTTQSASTSSGLSVQNLKELMFNVKLNGMGGPGLSFVGGGVTNITINGASAGSGGANDVMAMFAATDFWGKYLLIK